MYVDEYMYDYVSDGIRSGTGEGQSNAYPHQFSLQDKSSGTHLCSATLIHPWLLLTAAHCIFGKPLGGLKALPGDDYYKQMGINNSTGRGLSLEIREAIFHPHFDPASLTNDIALLRMDQRVAYSNGGGAEIIAVLPQPKWRLSQPAILMGWGLSAPSSPGAPSSGSFETAPVPVERKSDCLAPEFGLVQNSWNKKFTNNMLCAGYEGDDSCQEMESGAVLMCERPRDGYGQLYVCGIGSWGYGCGTQVGPMVYTDVRKYRSWISKEMRKLWTSN